MGLIYVINSSEFEPISFGDNYLYHQYDKIASFLLAHRKSWDDRKLCVECEHIKAFNGSWKCGNWRQAGLTTNINGSGLSWHLITLFQRCNGFSGA